ncbi:hypothetical protein, partial [Synechococcus lacustris]|uniref:hypothetical protein n=1 Tax=Synechococcus lacustris TaxID=2116544 RepID=UPI0020CCF71D
MQQVALHNFFSNITQKMSNVNFFHRPQTIESSKHATKTLINRGDRIRTCDLVLPKQMTRQSPHYDFE